MLSMTPTSFSGAMQTYDPNLHLRRSRGLNSWIIEVDSFIPIKEMDYLYGRKNRLYAIAGKSGEPHEKAARISMYHQVAEEFKSAKSKRRVVIITPFLNHEVMQKVIMSDFRNYNGYNRMADEWDKAERQEEKSSRRAFDSESEDRHKETFDMINFLCRKKSTEMYHGERDLNVLLHGRKSGRAVVKSKKIRSDQPMIEIAKR